MAVYGQNLKHAIDDAARLCVFGSSFRVVDGKMAHGIHAKRSQRDGLQNGPKFFSRGQGMRTQWKARKVRMASCCPTRLQSSDLRKPQAGSGYFGLFCLKTCFSGFIHGVANKGTFKLGFANSPWGSRFWALQLFWPEAKLQGSGGGGGGGPTMRGDFTKRALW